MSWKDSSAGPIRRRELGRLGAERAGGRGLGSLRYSGQGSLRYWGMGYGARVRKVGIRSRYMRIVVPCSPTMAKTDKRLVRLRSSRMRLPRFTSSSVMPLDLVEA
jgi:hypothetical protein